MTAAERARQIDREEFAAECAAARQRAYILLKRKPRRDPLVDEWIKRGIEPASVSFMPQPSAPQCRSMNFQRPAVMHEAFGKAQSLDQWANEYGIAKGTVRTRLKLGWTLESALLKPPGEVGKRAHLPRPGVVINFPPSTGTGAGSTSQETPNLTFSESAACPQ